MNGPCEIFMPIQWAADMIMRVDDPDRQSEVPGGAFCFSYDEAEDGGLRLASVLNSHDAPFIAHHHAVSGECAAQVSFAMGGDLVTCDAIGFAFHPGYSGKYAQDEGQRREAARVWACYSEIHQAVFGRKP